MLKVTLYTKPECSLCHDAADILARLRERYPHQLVEVDIRKDADLFRRYRHVIPVVEIEERTLQAPLTALQLREALAEAT